MIVLSRLDIIYSYDCHLSPFFCQEVTMLASTKTVTPYNKPTVPLTLVKSECGCFLLPSRKYEFNILIESLAIQRMRNDEFLILVVLSSLHVCI